MKPAWQMHLCVALFAAGCLAALANAAPAPGDKVWSKHHETALLAEPRPLAATVATVGFAREFRVQQVQGAWLNIRGDGAEGWIFQGNVAAGQPQMAPSAGLSLVSAADTDTVAAARPLAPVAQDYAERHGEGDAQAGIDWVDAQAATLGREEVLAWMSEHQLGEYRP